MADARDSSPYAFPYNNPVYSSAETPAKSSTSIPNSSFVVPITRTPSPTPSEEEEAKKGMIDWKVVLNWRTYAVKKYIPYYIIFFIIILLTSLIAIYHTQIVHWLTPATQWMKNLKVGWLIPIAILFVLSFPPLFGAEIVAILCGVVWGLWAGFGIVAAGTVIGEVGNFYAFRYCCKARGDKLEKNNLNYACLVKVVKEGGFRIALVARLSAIPGHFTTAVFSTCGMSIITFFIAATLSSPKQLVTVYIGVILEQTGTGTESTKSKIISDSVLVLSLIITVLAAWWIYSKMLKAKPEVLRERRRLRGSKISVNSGLNESTETFHLPIVSSNGNGNNPYQNRASTDAFSPADSDSDVHAPISVHPQRWDAYGNALNMPYDPPYSGQQRRAYLPYQVASQFKGAGASDDTITESWENGRGRGGQAQGQERAGEYVPPPPQFSQPQSQPQPQPLYPPPPGFNRSQAPQQPQPQQAPRPYISSPRPLQSTLQPPPPNLNTPTNPTTLPTFSLDTPTSTSALRAPSPYSSADAYAPISQPPTSLQPGGGNGGGGGTGGFYSTPLHSPTPLLRTQHSFDPTEGSSAPSSAYHTPDSSSYATPPYMISPSASPEGGRAV